MFKHIGIVVKKDQKDGDTSLPDSLLPILAKYTSEIFIEEGSDIKNSLLTELKTDDFLKQIQQIKKMGNIKDLAGMIPGVGKAIKDVDIDDDAFKGIESIIYSMTPYERSNPNVLNGSRKKRIASGSGTNVQEINQLIKQFSQMGKMMKMMQGGGASKMMEMMKGNNLPRF